MYICVYIHMYIFCMSRVESGFNIMTFPANPVFWQNNVA